MIGNTVAYSNKLFISAPQNCCTKNAGKFPKKIAHASFAQCSANVVLGQDDFLRKINLNVLWNHTVRESGKAWHGFPSEAIVTRSYPW